MIARPGKSILSVPVLRSISSIVSVSSMASMGPHPSAGPGYSFSTLGANSFTGVSRFFTMVSRSKQNRVPFSGLSRE